MTESIYPAPYKIYWDNGVEACGSIDCKTLDEAKDGVIEILHSWMQSERESWNGERPKQEQKESWDTMIYNAYAEVRKYNKYTDLYEEEWLVPDETLKEIGWVTFRELERNMYEISSIDKYVDEDGHKRMIISILNKSDDTQFDIMVRDTGLVYIMGED